MPEGNGQVEVPQRVERIQPVPTATVQESRDWKAWIAPVVISAVLSFIMIQMVALPKVDDVSKFAATTQADVNALKPEVAKIAGMQGQVTQATTIGNNNAADINGIKSREASFLTSDKLTPLQTQLTQLSSTVTGLGNQSGEITKLKDQLAALTKTVNDIQSTLNATTSLGTSGAGGTVVAGQVVPSVIGNPFTGVQYLKYDTTANNTTNSQTLSFQIANGTGKTINNLQLGLLLQLYDASGANLYTFPAGATLGVQAGSNMLGTIWTEQSTGVSYYRGFTNSALTGMLGNIGALSQTPGVQTYSVTVSITNYTGATLPTVIMYPVVKVLSFN